MKNVTWVLPASALVAIGVLAYALYQHPVKTSSNGSGVQYPGFTGLSPTAPSSPNTMQSSGTYATQGFNAAPLTMPTGNIPNLQIPAINVPAMVVNNNLYNSGSGASCGGCGNF